MNHFGTLGCGSGCSCGPCRTRSLGGPRPAFGFAPGRFSQVVAPPALPTITKFEFVTAGTTHPDNCSPFGPITLGVGRRIGAPLRPTASNGVEMRFTVAGYRKGVDLEITRTRRDSVWQQRAGAWTMLDSHPMGTGDDPRPDGDECRVPHNGRIFVIDAPGYPFLPLPVADGHRWPTFNPAVSADADADNVVIRFSFAEWVMARDQANGIPWTRLALTAATTQPHIYWHSITWITRNGARQWVLDVGRSRIQRGSLSAAVINSAPVP